MSRWALSRRGGGDVTPRFSYDENVSRRITWEERFQTSTCPVANGCIEWTGARLLPPNEPYGVFTSSGKRYRAHRAAWIMAHGPIPDGMMVCHRCDNPPCCNPEHLFLGSAKDNAEDMVSKGRWAGRRSEPEWKANIAARPGSKGGRPKSETPARARSFWLTDELILEVDERAAAEEISRSELVRQALVARLTSPPIRSST